MTTIYIILADMLGLSSAVLLFLIGINVIPPKACEECGYWEKRYLALYSRVCDCLCPGDLDA